MGFFKKREVPPEPEPVELAPPELVVAPEETHSLRSENYEPHFPRVSVTRRVLGHITDEVDRTDLGPRNTLEAITAGVIADDHTEISYPEQVQPYLDSLVTAGLASVDDGTYTVTDAGWRELMN